jgi:hypothetical protein
MNARAPLRACFRTTLGAALALAIGCAERTTPAAPPDASVAPASTDASPSVADQGGPAAAKSAEPPTAASAPLEAEEPADEPEVAVEVKNIGMHIGGGPNDKETKAPIKSSVEPHFDAFARCFAKAEDTAKGGDFGVDLRIEPKGGKAKVSEPRTAIRGDDFKGCVISVFEAIDFHEPKGGATVVSYSLRFTPE